MTGVPSADPRFWIDQAPRRPGRPSTFGARCSTCDGWLSRFEVDRATASASADAILGPRSAFEHRHDTTNILFADDEPLERREGRA